MKMSMSTKVYVVIFPIEGTVGNYTFVYHTKKDALRKVINLTSNSNGVLLDVLESTITDADVDFVSDQIDWTGVDMQVQYINSNENPNTLW